MRYEAIEEAGQFKVVDRWAMDPEHRNSGLSFFVCSCPDVDRAEKIAKALNLYDGDTKPYEG